MPSVKCLPFRHEDSLNKDDFLLVPLIFSLPVATVSDLEVQLQLKFDSVLYIHKLGGKYPSSLY